MVQGYLNHWLMQPARCRYRFCVKVALQSISDTKRTLKVGDLDEALDFIGAGEGNRTLISGLGSPHSTTEPHPHRC